MRLYGGIEAGGTKFVCAVGSGPDGIVAETRFPTLAAKQTIDRIIGAFSQSEFSKQRYFTAR